MRAIHKNVSRCLRTQAVQHSGAVTVNNLGSAWWVTFVGIYSSASWVFILAQQVLLPAEPSLWRPEYFSSLLKKTAHRIIVPRPTQSIVILPPSLPPFLSFLPSFCLSNLFTTVLDEFPQLPLHVKSPWVAIERFKNKTSQPVLLYISNWCFCEHKEN